MPADSHAGFHLFTAGWTILEPQGNVGPLTLGAKRLRCASMEVGNFAKRVSARPERVTFGDQVVIVGVAARGGRGELIGRRTRSGANENSMVVQILQKIFRNFASGDCEWKAAIVAEVDHVAARSDQQQRVWLAFRTRWDVINAMRSRNVPVLVRNRRDCDRRGGVAFCRCVDALLAATAGCGSAAGGVRFRHCHDCRIQESFLSVWSVAGGPG